MKNYKVGYDLGNGIYSMNIIWANTGVNEKLAVEETADRHARKYGYEVDFVEEVSEYEVEEALRKNVPIYPIDEEAEHKYDPSFANDNEEEFLSCN